MSHIFVYTHAYLYIYTCVMPRSYITCEFVHMWVREWYIRIHAMMHSCVKLWHVVMRWRTYSHKHTHTLSFFSRSLFLSLSFSLSIFARARARALSPLFPLSLSSRSLFLSLCVCLSLAHTYTHTRTPHTHTRTLTYLKCLRILQLFFAPFLVHPRTHTHTFFLSLSLSLSHTWTHSRCWINFHDAATHNNTRQHTHTIRAHRTQTDWLIQGL